jgi:superfamily II DNA helicase RecQ
MPVRVLTIAFDPQREIFRDEDLSQFLLSKRVTQLKAEFFMLNGSAYWTVFVEYETVLPNVTTDTGDGLDEAQRLLFQRLREWRKEKAEPQGVPVYIIATNSQLTEVARRGPRTVEALRQIQGFGKKKVERYGRELTEMIMGFYEEKPPSEAPALMVNEQPVAKAEATQ